jgi:hypothetical protein
MMILSYISGGPDINAAVLQTNPIPKKSDVECV